MLTKKQIRRNWKLIYALQSGKYRQIIGHLARFVGGKRCFCVAGVACDLSNLDQWESGFGRHNYLGEGYFMPNAVKDFYGWPSVIADQLTAWNDKDRLTFPQIADKLEKWLVDQINKAEAA